MFIARSSPFPLWDCWEEQPCSSQTNGAGSPPKLSALISPNVLSALDAGIAPQLLLWNLWERRSLRTVSKCSLKPLVRILDTTQSSTPSASRRPSRLLRVPQDLAFAPQPLGSRRGLRGAARPPPVREVPRTARGAEPPHPAHAHWGAAGVWACAERSGPGRSPRPPRPGAARAAQTLPGVAGRGEAEWGGMNSSDEEKQLELLVSLKDRGRGGRRLRPATGGPALLPSFLPSAAAGSGGGSAAAGRREAAA